jgi:hypothetical protein
MIIEGELYLQISNDTIIAPHAIDNMIRAMREDETIGWIVPTTPNISNFQTIPGDFTDYDSFLKWVEKNNIYNPYRHEVRTRLCNPIALYRSSTYISRSGIGIVGRQHTQNTRSMTFPDDLMSMLFRRRGLKSVLAKDAFCHHFGSVTINDDADEVNKKSTNAAEAYTRGRLDFKRAFGIDPWGTGFCYDYALAQSFECKFEGHIEVLGINCGLGSNSLKIKELYKEHKHNLDVNLTNVTGDESVLLDLRGVSDSAAVIRNLSDAFKDGRDRKYHYIVFEDEFKGIVHNSYGAADLFARLIDGGELYIKCGEEVFKGKFDSVTQIGDWVKITRL